MKNVKNILMFIGGAFVLFASAQAVSQAVAKPRGSHDVALDEIVCKQLIVCDDPREGGKYAKYKCVIQAIPDEAEPQATPLHSEKMKNGGIYVWLMQEEGKPIVSLYNADGQGAVMGLWNKLPPNGYHNIGMNFAISTQGDGVNIQSVSGGVPEKIKIMDAKNIVFGKEAQ